MDVLQVYRPFFNISIVLVIRVSNDFAFVVKNF